MTTITIRDVPTDVRDELAARAAQSGRSLQSYLSDLLARTVARPSQEETIARARARVEAESSSFGADEILAARDADRR